MRLTKTNCGCKLNPYCGHPEYPENLGCSNHAEPSGLCKHCSDHRAAAKVAKAEAEAKADFEKKKSGDS
jgi:hypothetical protein